MGSGADAVSVLRSPIWCDWLGEERRGCPALCTVLLLSRALSLSVIPPVFSHSPLFFLHQPPFFLSLFSSPAFPCLGIRSLPLPLLLYACRCLSISLSLYTDYLPLPVSPYLLALSLSRQSQEMRRRERTRSVSI